MGDLMAETQDNLPMVCEEVWPLLAAYAIGDATLDAPTRTHLLACQTCQQTLREYSGVVQMLPFDAPPVAPPPALRDRLIAAVQAETMQATSGSTTRTSAPPASAQARKRRGPIIGLRVAFGTALVVIVALLGWNISLQQQLASQTTALTANREGWQTLVGMLNDPTLVSYRMSGSVAQGTVWGVPQRELACLMIENLPAPPSGQIYQVWLRNGKSWSSAGTFEFRPGNRWFMIRPMQAFSNYSAVLVTTEPAGGSEWPTGPALIQGDLTIRT